MQAIPYPIQALYVGLIGLLIGSFLNVVIHRVPRQQSIVRPRSRCASCGEGIAWYQNIPVLSYVLLRGRCAHCGTRISFRYVAVEIVTAALLVGLPFRQRSAIVLRFYGRCSEAEIAAALDCATGTVGSLIHRGLASLRRQLDAADHDPRGDEP